MANRSNDDHIRTLVSRESWIDQAIRDAQQRGEFDNLAGYGKPQNLTVDPHAGDWETGFRVLKNNGLAPAWIEADKAIRAEQAALNELAERTAQFIADHRAEAEAPQPVDGEPAGWSGRLRRLWSGRPHGHTQPRFTLDSLRYERDRARREYLRRTEELNQTIHEYNTALPFNLLWRERRKVSPEQAAAAFDAVCPPVG